MSRRPTIYSRSESGLAPVAASKYSRLGQIYSITCHHSAGPRARTKAEAQRLNRQYQLYHQGKGWTDIGYHFSVDDLGRIYCLRPVNVLGAHVGGWNTGNIGIMFHGNYDRDELTWQQRATIEWLFKGGFYVLTRTSEYDYRFARTHQEWPGHFSNACPGKNLQRHWAWRRKHAFH